MPDANLDPVDEIEIRAEKLRALRERWIQLSCRPRTTAIKKVEGVIRELESGVYEYQKALIGRIKLLEDEKAHLIALHTIPSEEVKGVEFDRLMQCPDIEDIAIDGARIIVTTKQIDIEYLGDVYDIGKFAIYLATDGGSGWLIRFKNLTRGIQGGYPHPHIEVNGAPCLGNIKECLPNMIGSYQFQAAILTAIQYLKSYVNDQKGKPYVHVNQWPKRDRYPVTNLKPPIPVEEGTQYEISRGVDRTQRVTEEVREALREVIEQREGPGRRSTSGESPGTDTGD